MWFFFDRWHGKINSLWIDFRISVTSTRHFDMSHFIHSYKNTYFYLTTNSDTWPHFCGTQLHSSAHQMEIFTQKFELVSYFCDGICVLDHELTKITKIWFSKSIFYVKNEFYNFDFFSVKFVWNNKTIFW